MGGSNRRVIFTLSISFLVLGIACLPLVKAHSAEFVVLVLSLLMNLLIVALIGISIRMEIRRARVTIK